MIEDLFPGEVVTVEATPAMYEAPLDEREAACLRPMAPGRRREFTAGRVCAREALRRLGVEGHALLPGVRRAPVWPVGIVGSITHCAGFCAAAVVRAVRLAGIGLDAEVVRPLPEEIVAMVGRAEELEELGVGAAPWVAHGPLLLFSAKESVYKAWYPLTGIELEFIDVRLRFSRDGRSFEAKIPELADGRARSLSISGSYRSEGGILLTAATITAAG
jgi:4'-phosphopantetheinyl transferase EntD